MIHLIYIYLIINAATVGFGIAENEKRLILFLMALFGTVFILFSVVAGISSVLWERFSSYWLLETWWRYCVVNKPYKQASYQTTEIVIEAIKKEKIPTLWHKMIWKKFIKTHNLDIKI